MAPLVPIPSACTSDGHLGRITTYGWGPVDGATGARQQRVGCQSGPQIAMHRARSGTKGSGTEDSPQRTERANEGRWAWVRRGRRERRAGARAKTVPPSLPPCYLPLGTMHDSSQNKQTIHIHTHVHGHIHIHIRIQTHKHIHIHIHIHTRGGRGLWLPRVERIARNILAFLLLSLFCASRGFSKVPDAMELSV